MTKATDPSGLVYFGARYYDPRIGRFITPDPSGMIDGPNLYLYCKNNPISGVDLWGLCVEVGYTPIDPFGLSQHTFLKVIYHGQVYAYGFDAIARLGLFSYLTQVPILGYVRPETLTGKETYITVAEGSEIAKAVLENISKSRWGIYFPLYNCYSWRNYILTESGLEIPQE